MTERWARALLAQAGIDQMVALVAYAETCAIVATGLCASTLPPAVLAHEALRMTLDGEWPWVPGRSALITHLQAHVRMTVAIALNVRRDQVDRARGQRGSLLSSAQVGNLDGIESIAHEAAQLAARLRVHDPDVRRHALALVELTRRRMREAVAIARHPTIAVSG